jgi:hypothetical protein
MSSPLGNGSCRKSRQAADGVGTGLSSFSALHLEVLTEEGLVFVVLVEVVRGEHCRNDRHVGVQLDAHEAIDHGLGHEIMAVDASIDHETGPDDRCVMTALGQSLGVEGDLECTWDPEQIDLIATDAVPGDLLDERVPTLIDDVLVPRGLYEGEPNRSVCHFMLSVAHRASLHRSPPPICKED